jgi:hypothetical protein
LKNFNLKSSKCCDLSIGITDWDRELQPHKFNFTISSEKELHYAVNLLKIYKTALRPYLTKNKRHISENVAFFDRLFSIVGEMNRFALGKTVHDTRVTMDLSSHVMEVWYFFRFYFSMLTIGIFDTFIFSKELYERDEWFD